jgi:general secretion pathway protein D
MRAMKRTFAVICLWLTLVMGAFAAEKRYEIPEGQVDLLELTRVVSKITGFSFVYGPSFTGKANLVVNHQVTAKEAFEIYLSVLSANGYTTVEKGRVIKIQPISDGVDPNLVFMSGEPIGPSDSRITVFIELTNLTSADAVEAAKPLAGPQGKVLASPVGNQLIVVDTAASVDRIRKAIAAMDREGPKYKIEVIPLERAGANQVAEMLNKLFPKVGGVRGNKFGADFTAVADTRTNSVIVKAPDEEVELSLKLLGKIDKADPGSEFHVEDLKNTDPAQMAEILDQLK